MALFRPPPVPLIDTTVIGRRWATSATTIPPAVPTEDADTVSLHFSFPIIALERHHATDGTIPDLGVGYSSFDTGLSQSISNPAIWVTQRFVPSISGTTRLVQTKMFKNGSPTDNVIVEIRDEVSGKPGSVLASATYSGTSISSAVVGLAPVISIPLTVSLTSGTPYYVTWRRSGTSDGTNYANIASSNTLGSPFEGGSYNSGTSTLTPFNQDYYWGLVFTPEQATEGILSLAPSGTDGIEYTDGAPTYATEHNDFADSVTSIMDYESDLTKRAQSFIMPATAPVTNLRLWICQGGAPSGNVVVDIRSDSSNSVGSTVLSTTTIPITSLPDDGGGSYYDISIPNVTLTNGQRYWIVVGKDTVDSSGDRLGWENCGTGTDSYPNGGFVVGGSGGADPTGSPPDPTIDAFFVVTYVASQPLVPVILTPSGSDVYTTGGPVIITDAGTTSLLFTVSAVESVQLVDTQTTVLALTPSVAETREILDSATARLSLTPSVAEISGFVDTNTTSVLFTPSYTEIREHADADTSFIVFTPSTAEVAVLVDSNTAAVLFTPSVIETRERTDAVTVSLLLTPSVAVEAEEFIDASTASILFTVSATDQEHFVEAPGDIHSEYAVADSLSSLGITNPNISPNQKFVSSINGTIRSVGFYANMVGAPTDGLVFELRDEVAGKPGAVLGTYTFPDVSGILVPPTKRLLTFPLTATLVSGTTYYIMWRRTAGATDTSNFINLWGSDQYPPIEGYRFTISSSNQVVTTQDIYYELRLVDQATDVLLKLTPSIAEIEEVVDSGTTSVVLTVSGTEFIERATTDATTTPLLFTASGSEVGAFVETSTTILTFSPLSGQEVLVSTDAQTSLLTFTPSSAETEQVVDAATTVVVFTPSGTEVVERATTDSATASITFTTSSSEVGAFVEASTSILTIVPGSSADVLVSTDAQTSLVLFTPSGVETVDRTGIDASTISLLLTPSVTELREQFDASTISVLFTVSASELRERSDAQTVSLVFTTASTEIRERFDANTVNVLFTTSAVELETVVEAATVNLLFNPSATEFISGTASDTGNVFLVFAVSAAEIRERLFTDAGTTSVPFTVSGSEGAIFADASSPVVVFSPSAAEVPIYVDSRVVPFSFTLSATETIILADTAQASVLFSVYAVEQFIPGVLIADSGEVLLVFYPYGVEQAYVLYKQMMLIGELGGTHHAVIGSLYGAKLGGTRTATISGGWSVNGS